MEMVDTSNIFSIRTLFRSVPCRDRHIYFADLDRISIRLPSSLFLMIPSYTNKEHAKEVGKKGFKDNMRGITGRHLKPSFFLCLQLLVLDRQEMLLAFLRAAAMLWLLVLWIEITFFHLVSAFCLFKTPTESFQADAIVFWSARTYIHTLHGWKEAGPSTAVWCGDPPHHKHYIFVMFIRMDYPFHSSQHSSLAFSGTCLSRIDTAVGSVVPFHFGLEQFFLMEGGNGLTL